MDEVNFKQIGEEDLIKVLEVYADEEGLSNIDDRWKESATRTFRLLSNKGDYLLGAFWWCGALMVFLPSMTVYLMLTLLFL